MIVKVNNRPVANPFNGLFNSLFGEFEVAQNQSNGNKPSNGFVPVNIVETENAYHLEVSAPGRKKENFKVTVEGQLLTISYENTPVAEGETEQKDLKQIRNEFGTSNFKRSFNVDEKINAENILAKYEDGLLKVLLPKKEETKPLAKEIVIA
jgi:HSP20 family protein